MKLKLINLGRHNVNKEVDINNPSFSAILKEVKKYLGSKGVDIEEDVDDEHTFNVFAGHRLVGQIWVEKPQFMILM
jgi:hypothetical protein